MSRTVCALSVIRRLLETACEMLKHCSCPVRHREGNPSSMCSGAFRPVAALASVGRLVTAHASVTVCVGLLRGEIHVADLDLGVSVRGYRRSIERDGVPDLTNAETNVSGNCLVLDDLNGVAYTSRVPLGAIGKQGQDFKADHDVVGL